MRKILIVKRHSGLRNRLGLTLYGMLNRSEETILLQCETFSNALARLRERNLSAIVTGAHLNDGSGEELYSAVRKREGLSEIPIIFFTRDPLISTMVNAFRHSGDRNVAFVHAPTGNENDIFKALQSMFKAPAKTRAFA